MSHIFPGSYYELLEIRPGSPQNEVTRAYERAKLTYSSDNPALYTVFTADEARELLKLIEEAYLVLGNAVYRSRYDEILKDPSIQLEELKFQDIVGPLISNIMGKQKAVFRPEYEVNLNIEEQMRREEHCDGLFLKKVREYKNISVDKMSEITRISTHYILALEKNAWSALPASVFVRGFVVQLSRLLGLEEKKTVDSFMKIYKSDVSKQKQA